MYRALVFRGKMSAVTHLTVREGADDAARSGYWVVTGPQDEDEVYAVVERSLIITDDGGERLAFSWYLHRRTARDHSSSYMRTVTLGEARTRDAAVAEIETAWREHIGMTVRVDDEQTAPLSRPWRT